MVANATFGSDTSSGRATTGGLRFRRWINKKSRAKKDFEGHEGSGILASIVCLIALNCDVASNSRPQAAAVVVEIPQITSMRRRRHARPPPSAKGLEMSVNYSALFLSYH